MKLLNSKTYKLLVRLQWLQIRRGQFVSSLLNRLSEIAGLVYALLFGYVAGIYAVKNGLAAKLLLAAVIVDLVSKFVLKKRSFIHIRPFLTLPVAKNNILTWLLIREMLAVRNLYLLFFSVAVLIAGEVCLSPFQWMAAAALAYLSSLCGSLMVNIFRLSRPSCVFLIFTLASSAIYVFYTNCYEALNNISLLSVLPTATAVLCVVCVMLGIANKALMKRSIYRMEEQQHKLSAIVSLPFMRNTLTAIHLLQIVRCRRTRGMLASGMCLTVMGLCLLLNGQLTGLFVVRQFALWMYIGSFGMVFAQVIITVESTCFDGLHARPLPLYRIICNRYRMYVAFALVMFLTVMPVCIHRNIPLLAPVAAFLFIAGPVYGLLFVNMLFARSRFELFDTAWGNWKGFSFVQNIVSTSAMFVPLGLAGWCSVVLPDETTYLLMTTIGVIIFGLHPYWIKTLCRLFEKRKYKSLEGFRL